VSRLKLLDEPRLALFDADGTLWDNDIADDCTLWMIATGRVKTASKWDEYRRILAIDGAAASRFLLELYAGLTRAELVLHVETYWREFMKLDYVDETVEVLRHLAERGFEVWVVTGSPTDFLEPLKRQLPVARIVGMDFEVDARGVLTGRHAGISCVGAGKAEKVRGLWSGPVQFAAGNSLLDEAMLRLARDVAWVVHPHADLEAIARAEGWEVKPSPRPPYGTTGWVSLADDLRQRGLVVPEGL
jgi:HAD superfamily phosphoserine phosphatase-like hydrolase